MMVVPKERAHRASTGTSLGSRDVVGKDTKVERMVMMLAQRATNANSLAMNGVQRFLVLTRRTWAGLSPCAICISRRAFAWAMAADSAAASLVWGSANPRWNKAAPFLAFAERSVITSSSNAARNILVGGCLQVRAMGVVRGWLSENKRIATTYVALLYSGGHSLNRSRKSWVSCSLELRACRRFCMDSARVSIELVRQVATSSFRSRRKTPLSLL